MACMCGDTGCGSCGPAQGANFALEQLEDEITQLFGNRYWSVDSLPMDERDDIVSKVSSYVEAKLLAQQDEFCEFLESYWQTREIERQSITGLRKVVLVPKFNADETARHVAKKITEDWYMTR